MIGNGLDLAEIGLEAPVRWKCLTELRKWHTPDDAAHLVRPADELVVLQDNLLVFGGASALLHRLTGGTTVTAFDNTNARIGVGTSSTAEAATQTTLVAQTLRKAMDATYPLHTDATTTGAQTATWRASFLNAEANAVWAEWGIFNGDLTTGVAAGGRMLNRKVQALGTKASGTWQLTVTVSLA